MYHNGGDRGVIGAHDCLREIWCNAVACHDLMISAPIIPVTGVILWIDDTKVAVWSDIKSDPLASM